MASEELHIIGILPESQASGYIKAEELRALMCDYLQLSPYHPVLLEILSEDGINMKEEKGKFDIQAIFKAVGTAYFTKNIPSFYNNRVTKYSIKLLKAAIIVYTRGLLTMAELRDGASAHQMKEFETLSIGVPLNIQAVHSILWVLRKTINNAVLSKWITAHARVMDTPGALMVHEFIYLMCNSVNKEEMLQKIPKIHMNVKMDKKIKIFQVEKDFAKTYETPDHKIQFLMSQAQNIDKAYIEGITSPPLINPNKANIRSHRKQTLKTDNLQEDAADSFRKKLRSMVLTVGIKTKLKEYHQKLIRSRLNGKAAYDKLVSHGEQALPNPLDLATQMKIEVNGSPLKKKILGSRPQTAQHRPHSISFNTQINTQPFKTLQSPSASPSSFSKLFVSPDRLIKNKSDLREMRIKSAKKEHFLTIQTKPLTLDHLSSPTRSTLQKKSFAQGSSTQTLPLRNWDLMDEFENILGEEYEAFEHQNLRHNYNRRTKSIAYFNSAFISPNITRIQSSKPGSPGIPTSPLNRRILASAKV